jgi:hypothetical protein
MPPGVSAGPDAVEPRAGSAPGSRLAGRSLDNCLRRRPSSGCDEQRTPKHAGKGTRSPGQDRGMSQTEQTDVRTQTKSRVVDGAGVAWAE